MCKDHFSIQVIYLDLVIPRLDCSQHLNEYIRIISDRKVSVGWMGGWSIINWFKWDLCWSFDTVDFSSHDICDHHHQVDKFPVHHRDHRRRLGAVDHHAGLLLMRALLLLAIANRYWNVWEGEPLNMTSMMKLCMYGLADELLNWLILWVCVCFFLMNLCYNKCFGYSGGPFAQCEFWSVIGL